ncbi:MAG: magnesium transporter [Deltaproteobacteria bacterium]
MVQNNVLLNIILKLLRVGASDKLEKILKTSSPEEIRLILRELDLRQKSVFLGLLFDAKMAVHTIRDFSTDLIGEIFNNIPLELLLETVNRLQPDDLADLVPKLSEGQSALILEKLDPAKKIEISRLLAYPASSAGGIMNPNVFYLPQTATVNEAIELIRTKKQLEIVFYLYVVDDEKHLVGIISLRQLIISTANAILKDVMNMNVIQVGVNQSQNEVAQMISRYNFLAIPIVDEEKRLVGVVSVDDVIDVIQQEATEDLYRMAGLEKDERVFTPIRQSVQKRAPWLVINLATAILASWVVSLFEGTIQKMVLLATFLPIVAGMGGNAGVQTITIMVRGLALGEIAFKDTRRALTKEVLVGVSNGLITGLIMAVVAYFWKGMPILGVVLMLAMIGNLFVSSAVGVLVPLGLKAVKIDPAVASTVVVTTFTDCFGFFFFLGLASLLLGYFI